MRPYLRKASHAAIFLGVYTFCSVWLMPLMAASAGQAPLPCRASEDRPLAAANWMYCAFNRNYVDRRMATLAEELAKELKRDFPGTTTLYLDGSFPAVFPFGRGLPLAPHLSHGDGLKLDIAYFYETLDGAYAPYQLRSPIGYWGPEEPEAGDSSPCSNIPWLAHSETKFLSPNSANLSLEKRRTAAALRWLGEKGPAYGVEKVFIEPYLAKRLGVSSPIIAFQGCWAARHDDHIHVQIRR
jgi:hypothetical protein